MDRSGTMSSLDVDEIVSSFDAKMMHPKDGPGFTHGVSFPSSDWNFWNQCGVSHLDHTVDGPAKSTGW